MWAQIDAYDPVAGAPVVLRAASVDDPAVCMAAGGPWWPMLAKLPVLRYDLFDGAFGGEISAPTGTIELQAEAWPNLGRYALADARVQLWTDISSDPIFDGRATAQPQLLDGRAQLAIRVDDGWLDKPLLATYAGTTGVEGPASLKGQPKPLALGAPRYVAGKLIDSVNNVFQVSAYGAVQAFEAALERLARFEGALADYPNYAALVAATVPAGTWATCKAQGLARFGAPPNGQVSFLMQGDASGPNGWARKPGQLIRRLALLSGGAGKIDDASLDALDAARPYNLSLYLDQQTTARQLIQAIAASVNAVAGVSWAGKLFVVPVGLGAASLTLAADGSALPPVRSVEQMEVSAPFSKVAMAAARAWTVHALADIAFADPLIDMGPYDPAVTYRAGNIVQFEGSSYRYSSATPSAGNAPPNTAYWAVLAAQGVPGEPGPPGKALTITSDRQMITYSSAGLPVPEGQTVTFTANKQNTAATVYWSLADGAGNPVSITYLSGATGDSVQMTEAAFAAARGTTKSVIVTATLTDGATLTSKAQVAAVQDGAASPSATALRLTTRSIQIQAFADGTVKGLEKANGQLSVWNGDANITAAATLSAVAEGCTGTINTAADTPVSGKPKGYYQITGMSADDGTLTLTAVVGGVTLSEVVSISKLRGGYEIIKAPNPLPTDHLFEGRMVFLELDGKLWRFHDGAWTSAVPAADLVGTVASSQLGIGVGGNQLIGAVPGTNPRNYMRFAYNPDGVQYYDVVTGGLTTGGQGVLQSLNFGYDPGPDYSLPDGSTFMVYQPNSQTGAAHFSDIRMARMKNQNGDLDEMWPIEEGKTYEFSLWACAYGCRLAVLIVWFDGDGNALSETPTGDPVANSYALVEPDEVPGRTTLGGYKRIYNRGKAPVGARQAMLVFRKAHTTPNASGTSRLFGARPMFAETAENATEMLPYSVPAYGFLRAENLIARSIVGEKVAFQTLIGDHMQIGSIDAARLAVTELSAITARIGLLRTASAGKRAEFRNDGVAVFNSSNVNTFFAGEY
ncbi:hypothetical protein GCM10009075_29510 [Sphingomonas trueperi]